MSYEFRLPPNQGWQCPICGRVYSPTTSMCTYCGGSDKAIGTWSTTTNPDIVKTHKYPCKSECPCFTEKDGKIISDCEIYNKCPLEPTNLEMISCVIEIFEDFLEEKGIDIPNQDRSEDGNASIIYGTDFGNLYARLEKEFKGNGWIK